MTLASYIRCSTDQQADSPEVQRAAIAVWAEREGHTIVAEYLDEAISGGLPIADRPAAARMLEDAKARWFDGIVAKQQDRLGRNAADTISFLAGAKRLGIQLLFVQESFADTPAGRLSYNILASLAQYYREDIGQKIRDHNVWTARQGRWPGGAAAFGYHWNASEKRLEVDESRAADAVTVFRLYVECGGSRERTARELNALGVPGPQGTHWQGIRVKRIIRNPLYRGLKNYAGEHHPLSDWVEVVPQDLVERAWELYQRTAGQRLPSQPNRNYVYTGTIYCARCGARMWCAHPPDPSRGISPQYRCVARIREGKSVCDAPAIAENRLDCLIVPQLAEIVRRHKAEILEIARVEEPRPDPSREAKRLQATKERLVDLYADGLIDRALFEGKLAEVNARIEEARGRMTSPRTAPDQSILAALLENVTAFWLRLSVEERRGVLQAISSRIEVYSGRPARATIYSPLVSEPIQVELAAYRCRLRDADS